MGKSSVFTPPDAIESAGLAALGGSWGGVDPRDSVSTVDALRQSRWLLERIADTSPIIIYVFDLALNRNVYCNRAVASVLGYTPAEIERMGDAMIPTLMHADDLRRIPEHLARIAAATDDDVIEFEYRMRHAGGAWRWLAGQDTVFARDAAGVPRQTVGAAMDITDRKLAETALRDSQHRYALATAAGRIVMWEYDIASDRVTTEPPMAELLGFAPGEYADRDAWDAYLHPDDREWVRRIGCQGFEPGAPRDADGNTPLAEIEYRLIGRDGVVYWVADRGAVLRRPSGEPYSAVGAMADITRLKRVEAEVRTLTGGILRAQDDERRRIARDLHDGVAQDLAAMAINLMRIDQMTPALPDDARSVLAATQELGERALRELRTLSYLLHPPLLEAGGLPDAIRDYANGFAKRTGIAVDLGEIASIEELSQAAETALYRVVQECLVNIQRHSGSESAAIVLASRLGETVLEIRDHGLGMNADRRGTTHGSPVQVGVGIASMRERLRHLGGWLEIRSGSSGTTVTARLPTQPAPLAHAER